MQPSRHRTSLHGGGRDEVRREVEALVDVWTVEGLACILCTGPGELAGCPVAHTIALQRPYASCDSQTLLELPWLLQKCERLAISMLRGQIHSC